MELARLSAGSKLTGCSTKRGNWTCDCYLLKRTVHDRAAELLDFVSEPLKQFSYLILCCLAGGLDVSELFTRT
jgi:hypothetical protein